MIAHTSIEPKNDREGNPVSHLQVARRVAGMLLFRGWRDLFLCALRGARAGAGDPLSLTAATPLLILGSAGAFVLVQWLGRGQPALCSVAMLVVVAGAAWVFYRVRQAMQGQWRDGEALSPLDCRAREVLIGLSLTVLSVFAACAGLEIYLSVSPPIAPGGLTYDQRVGLRLTPKPGLTNSLGFHDRERSLRKPPGTYRIVTLGDSFTFGCLRREQNFPALLEEGLVRRLHRPVEVINLGVPSTGPSDYLQMLRVLGLEYQPDMVLLNLFVGNDFEVPIGIVERNVYVQGIRLTPPPHWYSRFWAGNWMLVSYVAAQVKVWRATQRTARRPFPTTGKAQEAPEIGTFPQDDYEKYVFGHLRICRRNDEWAQRRFQKGLKCLAVIHGLCAERNGPFVLALLPDEFQVDDAFRERVLTRFKEDPAAYDIAQPQRILRQFARDHQIPVVDMLPAFRKASRRERLYLPLNTHWNAAGNRLAARLLLEALPPLMKKRS